MGRIGEPYPVGLVVIPLRDAAVAKIEKGKKYIIESVTYANRQWYAKLNDFWMKQKDMIPDNELKKECRWCTSDCKKEEPCVFFVGKWER